MDRVYAKCCLGVHSRTARTIDQQRRRSSNETRSIPYKEEVSYTSEVENILVLSIYQRR